jgi:hypothetical protein
MRTLSNVTWATRYMLMSLRNRPPRKVTGAPLWFSQYPGDSACLSTCTAVETGSGRARTRAHASVTLRNGCACVPVAESSPRSGFDPEVTCLGRSDGEPSLRPCPGDSSGACFTSARTRYRPGVEGQADPALLCWCESVSHAVGLRPGSAVGTAVATRGDPDDRRAILDHHRRRRWLRHRQRRQQVQHASQGTTSGSPDLPLAYRTRPPPANQFDTREPPRKVPRTDGTRWRPPPANQFDTPTSTPRGAGAQRHEADTRVRRWYLPWRFDSQGGHPPCFKRCVVGGRLLCWSPPCWQSCLPPRPQPRGSQSTAPVTVVTCEPGERHACATARQRLHAACRGRSRRMPLRAADVITVPAMTIPPGIAAHDLQQPHCAGRGRPHHRSCRPPAVRTACSLFPPGSSPSEGFTVTGATGHSGARDLAERR